MHTLRYHGNTSAAKGVVLGLLALLSNTTLAVPVEDSPRQYLMAGMKLPPKFNGKLDRAPGPNGPYTPGFKDPYDNAVDAVGDDLDPLPWRNGLGASVLGPWNPDLVRPPSTDRGDMPNLRWSFADSHVRIEVSETLELLNIHDFMCYKKLMILVGGRLDAADYRARARCQCRAR